MALHHRATAQAGFAALLLATALHAAPAAAAPVFGTAAQASVLAGEIALEDGSSDPTDVPAASAAVGPVDGARAQASASLREGTLRTFATGRTTTDGSATSFGNAVARLFDRLDISAPGASFETPVTISLGFTLTGAFAVPASPGVANLALTDFVATISASEIGDDAAAPIFLADAVANLIRTSVESGDSSDIVTTASVAPGIGDARWTVTGGPTGNSIDWRPVLSLDLITDSVSLLLDVGMSTIGSGATADFSNTAAITLTLPAGVTVSSASGVFLTPENGGGVTPVPEPASLALLGIGLLGLAAAARRRAARG